MRTLGNILWHIPFLGFLNAIFTFLGGLIATVLVLPAPIGLGLMEFSKFLMAPFSNAMVSKTELGEVPKNGAWETYQAIVMVIYFPFGLLLCVLALFQIVGMFLSIVGIPVALVVAKSLGTYLNPVNKKCVPQAVADELERKKGQRAVQQHLG